jgi:uncharacterized phage-associated protein
MDNKVKGFEYLLTQLVNWHSEATGKKNNDISVLKALKLLFFVSAVNANKDSTHDLIDEVFDNFVAMPYGHVESDVYNAIKGLEVKNVEITNREAKILHPERITLTKSHKDLIDSAITSLKEVNPYLITLPSFDLVELSHNWYSWQYYYNKAKEEHKLSSEIPTKVIKEEEKIFQL